MRPGCDLIRGSTGAEALQPGDWWAGVQAHNCEDAARHPRRLPALPAA